MNEPKLQASLGEVTSTKTKKDRNWNMGYLALGKVIRVHPKRYTADVQIFGTNDVVTSAKDQEGRHACRIGVSNAGYSELHKKAYGEIVPIQKGTIVLVGFLKNHKEKPVILRTFHDIGEELGENNLKNILNSSYEPDADDTINRYVNITSSQDFFMIDDNGNFEVASHSKSFLVGKERALDDEFYDYEDLEVKNPDQTTISVDEEYSQPKKYMAVFRDNFKDSLTNWLKIIVDAARTSFRIAKLQQSENKSTYLEIDQNGALKVRRQLDTKSFEDSQKYSEFTFDKKGKIQLKVQRDPQKYSEFTIDEEGKIQLQIQGDTKTVVTLNSDGTGLVIETEDPIKVTSDQDITLKSKTLNVSGDSININGNQVVNISAPQLNLN